MKHFIEFMKFLRNFHRTKIEKLKDRYRELDELSNIALEMTDVEAYKSLQREMNEVFFDYLTAVAVDSVYKLVPHVFIIWLISLKWESISIPIVGGQVSILVAYLLVYGIFNISPLLFRPIKWLLSKSSFLALSVANRR